MGNKFELALPSDGEGEKGTDEPLTPEVISEPEPESDKGSIGSAQNFDGLFSVLDEMGGVRLLDGNIFTSEKLSDIITALGEFVQDKREGGKPILDESLSMYPYLRLFDGIPETDGLREKVFELMRDITNE